MPAGSAGAEGGLDPTHMGDLLLDTEPRKVLEQVSEMTKLIFKSSPGGGGPL